jgi:hypothetical protein
MTIDHFYQYGSPDDIVLIDEYDEIIGKYPYSISNEAITGIWVFKDKNVFAFSATTSRSIERLVFKVLSMP